MNEMKETSDTEFINILFYSILDRGALIHEAFIWAEEVRKNGRSYVLNKFLTSEEFAKLLKAKGIRAL